jgi:hypothetical protein
MKFRVYETDFGHLKGQPLKDSYKSLGELDGDGWANFSSVLQEATKIWPNKLGYRLAEGQMALDFSDTLCVMCGIGKVGMWVGGNSEPRRVIRVCPKCEGQERVGKVSS